MPWFAVWFFLLTASIAVAQTAPTRNPGPRAALSLSNLADNCLDTTKFQKWILELDSTDNDSSDLISAMVQPSLTGNGHEIHTGAVGYPPYSLWGNPARRDPESRSMGVFHCIVNQRDQFYFPAIPITRIEFQAGGNNLQILQLNHHQRIGPALSAGTQVKSITHNGFLQRSGSKIRNTEAYLIGSLRPGRHFIHASYQILTADISENGGMTSHILPVASGYNPLNLNIHLLNANSTHQEELWSLENRWSWRVHQPRSPRLVQRLRRQTLRWKFSDETVADNLAFYPDPSNLIDSTSSRDSLRHSIWTHTLGMEHRNVNGIGIQYGLEFSHLNYFSGSAMLSSGDKVPDAVRSDRGLIAFGRWESHRKGLWVDWRQGLYHSFLPLMSSVKVGWQTPAKIEEPDSSKVTKENFRPRFLTSVMLEAFVDPPSYAQRWMKTNSAAWNLPELQSAQGLLLTSEWQGRGRPQDRWTLRMGVMRQLIGLGFAGSDTLPTQSTPLIPGMQIQNSREAIAYIGLRILGTLQTGKPGRFQWAWRYHHLWQWANNPTWFPLPLWACDDWLYVQRRTSAGWTWLTGLAVRYQTPFAAPRYRPELGMWTLGKPSPVGKPINSIAGGYPVVDLLAGIKVRRTLLYIRWEHANMGWPEQIGQLTPAYPLGDRRLRFGLDWKFLD